MTFSLRPCSVSTLPDRGFGEHRVVSWNDAAEMKDGSAATPW
jgi:hypothetical protein